MHWQSMKGGRGHYFEAERRGVPLEAAVVLGGDPILMMSSIFPLPEGLRRARRGRLDPWRADTDGQGQVHWAARAFERRVRSGRTRAAGRTPDGGSFRRPFRPLLRSFTLSGLSCEDGDPPPRCDLSGHGRGQAAAGRQVSRYRRGRAHRAARAPPESEHHRSLRLRRGVLPQPAGRCPAGTASERSLEDGVQPAGNRTACADQGDGPGPGGCGPEELLVPALGALVAVRAGGTDASPARRAAGHAGLHVLHDARREQGDLRCHRRTGHVRTAARRDRGPDGLRFPGFRMEGPRRAALSSSRSCASRARCCPA